jgi:uncharacterized coiled-coil DUF342 family protein
MAIYILFQIPFFKDYADSIKASIFEKAQNVTNEVNRINGEIEGVKEKIDMTGQKVVEITNTVNKTKEGMANTLTTAKKAIDSVQSALTDEEGPSKSISQPSDPNTNAPKEPVPATK